MDLTKLQLYKEVAKVSNKTAKETKSVLDALAKIINEAIDNRKNVYWKGLMIIKYKTVKERKCTLSKAVAAGKTVIPAHEKLDVRMSASKRVKNAVNTGRPEKTA